MQNLNYFLVSLSRFYMFKLHSDFYCKMVFQAKIVWILIACCWISTIMANPTLQFIPQQPVSSEALLRFPFTTFLANPCGFMAVPSTESKTRSSTVGNHHTDSGDDYLLSPLRILSTTGSISQQTLQLLDPIRERYAHRNYSAEERATAIQEFLLILQESRHINQHIFPESAMHHCDGMQLRSLHYDIPLGNSLGNLQLGNVYRRLAITAAHLHLMIRDAFDSGRYCPNENRAQHNNIRQLAGKVESLMCLLWPPAVGEGIDLFHIIEGVLETVVHRYYDCSAREIRGCLVVRYANNVFNEARLVGQQQLSA